MGLNPALLTMRGVLCIKYPMLRQVKYPHLGSDSALSSNYNRITFIIITASMFINKKVELPNDLAVGKRTVSIQGTSEANYII